MNNTRENEERIRESIKYTCKIVNYFLKCKVSFDLLRKASVNKAETYTLWYALLDLIVIGKLNYMFTPSPIFLVYFCHIFSLIHIIIIIIANAKEEDNDFLYIINFESSDDKAVSNLEEIEGIVHINYIDLSILL